MIERNGANGPADIALAGPDGLQATIVALDPGGTTGWARAMPVGLFCPDELAFDGGQLGPREHHGELYDHLTMINPDFVVIESFDFRQHKYGNRKGQGVKDKVELISREYIGVAKLWCQRYGVGYTQQMPFQMSKITNDKLARLSVLHHGKLVEHVHYHDAMRHLLYYIVHTLRIKKGIADKWL